VPWGTPGEAQASKQAACCWWSGPHSLPRDLWNWASCLATGGVCRACSAAWCDWPGGVYLTLGGKDPALEGQPLDGEDPALGTRTLGADNSAMEHWDPGGRLELRSSRWCVPMPYGLASWSCCTASGGPVTWACFTFVSLHFVFDSMKSGGVLVKHASWWPDGYQSMTLCLRTVGPADWSPEEARSEAWRSGDETSAGAAVSLRGRLFFLLSIIITLLLYFFFLFPDDKRRMCSLHVEVVREGFLSFLFFFSDCGACP